MPVGFIDGKPTTAYKLFHNLYSVEISNLNLYGTTHAKRGIGLASLGNNFDSETLKRMTTEVLRTPVAMALLHDKGITVNICDIKDTLVVYDLIKTHLANWAAIAKDPTTVLTPPPLSDLLILDNYANHIYDYAEFERLSVKARHAGNDTSGESLNSIFALFGGSSTTTVTTRRERGKSATDELADSWGVVNKD